MIVGEQDADHRATSTVSGVTPEFLPVRSFEIAQGRFFSASDLEGARNVTVIGPDLRDKLLPLVEQGTVYVSVYQEA
jgi:putative ABC transport system permease protein